MGKKKKQEKLEKLKKNKIKEEKVKKSKKTDKSGKQDKVKKQEKLVRALEEERRMAAEAAAQISDTDRVVRPAESSKPGSDVKTTDSVKTGSDIKVTKSAKMGSDDKAAKSAKQDHSAKMPSIGAADADSVGMAEILRAFGDINRLQILELLREDELCARDLLEEVDIVQSTLSHHMKLLVEAGVVKCRKQGKWSYYSLDRDTLAKVSDYLMNL